MLIVQGWNVLLVVSHAHNQKCRCPDTPLFLSHTINQSVNQSRHSYIAPCRRRIRGAYRPTHTECWDCRLAICLRQSVSRILFRWNIYAKTVENIWLKVWIKLGHMMIPCSEHYQWCYSKTLCIKWMLLKRYRAKWVMSAYHCQERRLRPTRHQKERLQVNHLAM